eukprot:1095672-Amorphochlora_amoeboformis.AAC.1
MTYVDAARRVDISTLSKHLSHWTLEIAGDSGDSWRSSHPVVPVTDSIRDLRRQSMTSRHHT